MAQAVRPRVVVWMLFLLQGTLLGIALVWGSASGCFWWRHLEPNLSALAALGLGGLASFLLWRAWGPPEGRAESRGWRLKPATVAQAAELFGYLSPTQLVGLALLTGVAEEALFRGIVLERWGLLASVAVFTALHAGPIHNMVWSMLWAWASGCYYAHTSSLLPCMAFHAASNAVSSAHLRKIWLDRGKTP